MSVVGSVRSNHGARGKSNTRMCFSWPKKTFSSKSGVFPLRHTCRSTYRVYWRTQKWHMQKEDKTQLEQKCILAILTHFNKMTTSHKIASWKMTNFAILSDFLIEFDNCLNDILGDIESCR